MKKLIPSEKHGSILVVVTVIMVTFSLMVAALLQLGSFSQIETVQQLRTTQAHWLAEAGLERALSRIFGSAKYRAGYSTKTFSNDETLLSGLGSYEVEIIKDDVSGSNNDDYTITSIGMVANNAMVVTNAVRLTFTGGPGLQTLLTGLSDSPSKFDANTAIDGPIFLGGSLFIKPGTSTELGGPVEAVGGVTGNSGEATQVDLPDPDGPLIDGTTLANYSKMRDDARKASPYGGGAISLAGGINYYSNSLTTLDAPITGSGTIVVSGDLDVQTPIPDNVTLIADGNINLNGTSLGKKDGKNTVFAFRDIDVTKCDFAGGYVGLVAMQGVKISAGFTDFKGLIYAYGEYRDPVKKDFYGVIFASGVQIMSGAIISWKGFYMGSNATITFDPSVFDEFNYLVNYGNSFVHQPGSWRWEQL